MQQPNQQPAGLLTSALSRLEQAARSAAPGLTQQVDRLCGALGIGTSTTNTSTYYPQATAMPPYPVPYPAQQQAPCWPQPAQQRPYPQPYSSYQQQQQQQQHNTPVTQVYPLPHPPAHPHAAPWQQQQQRPQPWQQQAPHHQQQEQQQQQREAQQEIIPILEATVSIKPSGLPVGSRPAAAAAAAAAGTATSSAPRQQVTVPLQQQLEQLWAARVPAAAQGPAAAAVVGSWYHTLSEFTFMPDGRCYWSRSSASTKNADHIPAAAAAADTTAAAGSSSTKGGGRQAVEVWHGVWKVQAGSSAGAGKIDLMYIIEQQQQQQQQPQQRWQRVVSYQTSALDDALVLDGLAHIKLGA